MRKLGLGFVGFLLLLGIWWAGAIAARNSRPDLPVTVRERLYPLPYEVLTAIEDVTWSDLGQNVCLSSCRVLLGFLAAAVVALPMGFGIGRLRVVSATLEPANDFLRYLPVAGFSSLTIFLLGTGNASAILVVFIGTVFHLVVATADAVRRVPSAYVDLGRTMAYGPVGAT